MFSGGTPTGPSPLRRTATYCSGREVGAPVGDRLTLSGTADDRFIINILGDFDLSGVGTQGSTQVAHEGGVTPNHVLLNFVGSNPTSISAGRFNFVDGTVLAPQRTIELGTVYGAIYGGAGQDPGITVGATLFDEPFVPIPEPAITVSALLGVILIACRRQRRRPG